MALFAVFGIPITFIGVKETLSSTVLYRNEIASLVNIPIIGEIEYHKKTRPMAIVHGQRSLAAEEFRRLRYALQFYLKDAINKNILVTSGISGEGKSFISTNLAIAYSLTGKKVLLIDMDLHNSSLGKIFKTTDKLGVMDYLSDGLDINALVQPVSGYDNLFFMPAGTPHAEPSGMLEHEKTAVLIKEVDELFDLVVIDSPPVSLVTDAHYLTNFCFATVYAVRHGFTPKVILKRFETNNAIHPLVNPVIVFNGVKTRGFMGADNGYGYGYKYGHGRGKGL
jgi:capsular exopolysaccharide synthesis family protein